MQILKGMRYRVYLQEEQEEFLRQVSGCVRFVYNIGLEQRQVFGCRDIPHHFGYAQQNKENGAEDFFLRPKLYKLG